MFCSRSISVYLLRGLGAVVAVALAIMVGGDHLWLVPPLVIGALVLMRGCPMCWLMGLVETVTLRRKEPF
jgi:uncharacterized membrane protein YoaK (UPF0700 family)